MRAVGALNQRLALYAMFPGAAAADAWDFYAETTERRRSPLQRGRARGC